MANASDRISKACNKLSFIDWDDLNEEEYVTLDKIINTPSKCSGVQFPFNQDGGKVKVSVANQLERAHDAPVFQPAVPPPAVGGYPIPVHQWTHGDPAMAPPHTSHYPITVPAGYLFQNQALSTNGEGTVFMPALTSGQPIYGIPSVPGHTIPTHYQATPLLQSGPVDLSIPVTNREAAAQPMTHQGNIVLPTSPTHPVVVTHVTDGAPSLAAAPPQIVSPVSLCHPGVLHNHTTQVVYIQQSGIMPPLPTDQGPEIIPPELHADEGTDNVTQPIAISGLPTVQKSSSLEFGGPVVFSGHSTATPNLEPGNNSMKEEDFNKAVVINMEGIEISNEGGNQKRNAKTEEPSKYSSEIDISPLSGTKGTEVSQTLSDMVDSSCKVQSPTNAKTFDSEHVKSPVPESTAKQTQANPVKMWSSLFGGAKSNNTPSGAQILSSTTRSSEAVRAVAVPNAIVTDEVKSVRYWQEQEKAESKQAFVPTDKVIPVGARNDPLAPKILEHLSKLPIIHTPIVIQPRGLVNGNNICFMNATLQVLMGCPPFVHMFRAFKNLPSRPGSYSSTPIFDSLVQFVNSFQNGQRIRNQGSRNKKGAQVDLNVGQPFSPAPLLSVAQNILRLHIGVQHDAEEFLSQILMICHEELENVMKLNHPDGLNNNEEKDTKNGYAEDKITDGEGEVDEDEDDESWQKVGPKNHHVETNVNDCGQTPLSSIFAGLSRSCYVRESGKTSDTLDSFFTLKLDIQAESVHSVKDALLRLNIAETVHDVDGGKVQGQRRMFFDTLPPVLIMHLKLFQYSNGNGQKIQKKIDFDVDLVIPKETLSRTGKMKYTTPKSKTYKLFGVVNHHGMKMNDGHYTSDVYLPAASGWLRFDDSEVILIHEAQVLQYSERRMPYLLFYRRMDVS